VSVRLIQVEKRGLARRHDPPLKELASRLSSTDIPEVRYLKRHAVTGPRLRTPVVKVAADPRRPEIATGDCVLRAEAPGIRRSAAGHYLHEDPGRRRRRPGPCGLNMALDML
jgi:hypothetical protein